MPRYVAFLRAINVGGHTVKMDRLRKLFEEMGFAEVETFIASGNVIFLADETDADALEAKIERELEGALGYAVGTFLRTPQELTAIAAYEPFPASEREPRGVYVLFLKKPPTKEGKEKLLALGNDDEVFHAHGREAYWASFGGMGQSKITGAMLDRAVGTSTNRNVNTVRKLAAKYPPA
ncbi:MAG TPA: DUF1697 domain-containing protein [Longimicrobium sp.]|nr:DUF1697 domain-containing protein [Longimicrobium sp.]